MSSVCSGLPGRGQRLPSASVQPGHRLWPTPSPTSPVGQLAWIVEKFKEWTPPLAALPEDAVDLDQLLPRTQHLLVHAQRRVRGRLLVWCPPIPRKVGAASDWPGQAVSSTDPLSSGV